jgi:hypothetical protein
VALAAEILKVFRKFAGDIEESVRRYFPRDEWLINYIVNELYGFDEFALCECGGMFCQAVVGLDYMVPMHEDDDYCPTAVVVFNSKLFEEDNNDILQWFCLPSLGIAISMRNRDMISFDSSIAHCVSNYRYEGTYIFSFFTSAAFALAQMALATNGL